MLSEGADFDKTPGKKSYSPPLLAPPSLQDNIDRCIIVWDETYNNNNTLYLSQFYTEIKEPIVRTLVA